MPKLNPTHIRHAGGFIKPASPTSFHAHVRVAGKQNRAKFKDLESAKLWIEGIARPFDENYPPLTRMQIADATRAQAMLPEGMTLTEAVRALNSAACYIGKSETEVIYGSPTLERAAADYLEARKGSIEGRTLDEHRRYLARLSGAVGGETRLGKIDAGLLEEFLRPVTPSVRNAALAYLSAFFTWALKRKWVSENPCEGVERAKRKKPPLGVLSPETFAELLRRARACDPSVVPYLVVGGFAGLRPVEAMRLRPDRIKAQYIVLDAAITKTADARTVEIRPNLRAWLDRYPYSVPAKDLNNVNKRVRRLCQTQPVIGWPHDCLRHSFATYAYEMTTDAPGVSAELGHSGTDIFFRHYRALACPGDGARWFAIAP